MIKTILHALGVLLVPVTAMAQEAGPIIDKTLVKSAPVTTSSPLTVLIGLLFVLAVIFGLAWLLKQYNNSGMVGNKAMKIVASMPLGTRERVVLIEVADKQILLGVAPGSVNSLHVFDEKVVGDSEQSSDFSSKLKQVLQARSPKPSEHESDS